MTLHPALTIAIAEIRWALRRLRADKWPAGGAVAVSMLGVGLNTAVFAVAYGVLLRPLPYTNPARLVLVEAGTPFSQFGAWRSELTSLEEAAAYARERLAVYGAGEPRLASVGLVSDGFFDTLGTRAEAGRPFTAANAALGTAVISERFARQAGLSPEQALGMHLTVGDAAVTVASVMPAAFAFPSEGTDLWLPARAAPAIAFDRSNDARRFQLIGRLKPSATLAELVVEAARAHARMDPIRQGEQREPIPVAMLRDVLLAPVRQVLIASSVAGLIVLLIASANIAAILVTRTLSRGQELAVRRAVGAPFSRLAGGVLAESIIVSTIGAVLGSVLAAGSVAWFRQWASGLMPRLPGVQIDWSVLLAALIFSTMMAIIASLPSVRSLAASPAMLRAAGGSRAPARLRGVLTVLQIALAVVLLTAGGLLTRTILVLLGNDIGASRSAVVSRVMLTPSMRFDAVDRAGTLHEILQRVRALPGVTAAGCGSNLPPDSEAIDVAIRLVDERGERRIELSLASVTPGYLPAIGARLLHGRDFSASDEQRGDPVVVLSAAAARVLFDGDAVGREMPSALPGLRGTRRATVIGITSEVRYSGLDAPARPTAYVLWNALPAGQPFLVVASTASAAALAPSLRAVLRDVDPRMPLQPVQTLDELVSRSVADRRLRAMLGGGVALLAFAVAMIGLFSSLTGTVAERRRELAIRSALGATPERVVRTIVQHGALLACAGLAIGSAGAIVAGRLLRSVLYGVSPHDPATLAGVAIVVAVASLGACYLPARRAARVDPLVLLRGE